MKDLLQAIQSQDRHTVQLAMEKLVAQPEIAEADLLDVMKVLPSIVAAFPEQSTFEYKTQKITWYGYESLIWEIGESFRQVLKQHKNFRKAPELFKAIEQVTLNSAFGKGRESFVMLLGQYGNQNHVRILKQLLKDPEVQGHAIYALRLLGASEAQDDIRPFLESPKTWVRNEQESIIRKSSGNRPNAGRVPNPMFCLPQDLGGFYQPTGRA